MRKTSKIPRLITIEELQDILRMSRRSIFRLIEEGRIGYVRPGSSDGRASRVVFSEEQVRRYIQERTRPSMPEILSRLEKIAERLSSVK